MGSTVLPGLEVQGLELVLHWTNSVRHSQMIERMTVKSTDEYRYLVKSMNQLV